MPKYKVAIDGQTIDEITHIVEDAFKESKRENELEALCNFVLEDIPPKPCYIKSGDQI